MPKLPILKPREIERALIKIGFVFDRQRGSHRMYIKGVLRVIVPQHTTIKKGTLSAIIKSTTLTVEEFLKW